MTTASATHESDKFARLGWPRQLWAVGAVHGEAARLCALHDAIGARFQPGDRLVYLGNMIGRSDEVPATLDELLAFRRALLAMPGMLVTDIVYLRGAQEEMWQKLLQLQFAPNPKEVFTWMLGQGLDRTLRAYGAKPEQGMAAARDGAVTLSRWTGSLREAMRGRPGHVPFYASLKRAAFTVPAADSDQRGTLFVSAGIDTSRPLTAQGDSFWWGGGGFERIDQPYEPFRRVVRGFDISGGGVRTSELTATLDAGCGRGGRLAAGLFTPEGEIVEIIEA